MGLDLGSFEAGMIYMKNLQNPAAPQILRLREERAKNRLFFRFAFTPVG